MILGFICWPEYFLYPCCGGSLKNWRGWRVSKAQSVKGKYEAQIERMRNLDEAGDGFKPKNPL